MTPDEEFSQELEERIFSLRSEITRLQDLAAKPIELLEAITRVHVLPSEVGKLEMGDDGGILDLNFVFNATLPALRLGNNTLMLLLGDSTTFLGLGN